MSGIRRHGRGAGTGHPPLHGHGRRGHRPARAYAGRAARRTRKPSDPGAGRRGTAVAEKRSADTEYEDTPHILWSDGPQAIPDRKAGRMIESYLRFSEQAPAPYDDLLRLVPPALAVLAALLAVLAVDQILQLVLRIAFGRAYSVRVPFSVRVGVDLHPDDVGSFSMGYPQWRSAKKDGTRDRRTNDLHVIKNRTLILIDGWKLRGKNPFEAYDLVRDLRRNVPHDRDMAHGRRHHGTHPHRPAAQIQMTSASRAPRRMARRLFHMLQVPSDHHMRRLRDSVLVVRRTTRTFPVKTKKRRIADSHLGGWAGTHSMSRHILGQQKGHG